MKHSFASVTKHLYALKRACLSNVQAHTPSVVEKGKAKFFELRVVFSLKLSQQYIFKEKFSYKYESIMKILEIIENIIRTLNIIPFSHKPRD